MESGFRQTALTRQAQPAEAGLQVDYGTASPVDRSEVSSPGEGRQLDEPPFWTPVRAGLNASGDAPNWAFCAARMAGPLWQ